MHTFTDGTIEDLLKHGKIHYYTIHITYYSTLFHTVVTHCLTTLIGWEHVISLST